MYLLFKQKKVGGSGRWCEATTSLFPWRKLLLLCLLQYISAFGESSLEASWHRQDNLFQGYAMVWYAMVFRTFSRLLEWGRGGREMGRWSCWCPKPLCPLHSKEVWFLPFKYWGFTLRFHLEKKNSAAEEIFENHWTGITEKAMATHSSILAWKIPWAEEPGGQQSMGSLRVRHDWVTSLSLFMHWRRKWQPLQCSCLENPRDGGGRVWWAAVYVVAQSQTRLKRLSSSSRTGSRIPKPGSSKEWLKELFQITNFRAIRAKLVK